MKYRYWALLLVALGSGYFLFRRPSAPIPSQLPVDGGAPATTVSSETKETSPPSNSQQPEQKKGSQDSVRTTQPELMDFVREVDLLGRSRPLEALDRISKRLESGVDQEPSDVNLLVGLPNRFTNSTVGRNFARKLLTSENLNDFPGARYQLLENYLEQLSDPESSWNEFKGMLAKSKNPTERDLWARAWLTRFPATRAHVSPDLQRLGIDPTKAWQESQDHPIELVQ